MQPTTQRPYLKSGIVDLEQLFERSRHNQTILAELLIELRQRSTDRAARLRVKVIDAMEAIELSSDTIESPIGGSAQQPNRPDESAAETPAPRAEPSESNQEARPAPRTTPPVTNLAKDILSAWTAVEVLSPQPYRKPSDTTDGDERRIARLERNRPLPWEGAGEKSRPNKRLFYQIVLGAIRMDVATKALLEVFVDSNADRQPAQGFTPIALLTVDKEGRPCDELAVALSSFAWGLPLALQTKLHALGEWADVERKLASDLDKLIRIADRDGKPSPLDISAIMMAHNWLVSRLGLRSDLIEQPTFAIRVYHYVFAQESPDAPLLGSFFLGDLAAARKLAVEGNLPGNLRKYLGIDRPAKQLDVIADRNLIAATVSPARFPTGRWPGKGRHPLALLQQAAVNMAVSQGLGMDLFPVNGPPGTGKTTLLRDVVAALVVRRAEAMCTFDDPESAFTEAAKHRLNNAQVTLSKVDPSLRGFEILVASSNNAAVENVSRELPSMDAIAGDAHDLRYFKTVGDNISKGREAWGLIAAVLGNSANRYAFREAAWLDKDRGLQAYLAEVAGAPQWIEEPDPARPGKKLRRKPIIVERENPPTSRKAAIEKWRSARQEFRRAYGEMKSLLEEMDAARREVSALADLAQAVEAASREVAQSLAGLQAARLQFDSARRNEDQVLAQAEAAQGSLAEHVLARPGLFSRLFGGTGAAEWKAAEKELRERHERLNRAHHEAKTETATCASRHQQAERVHAAARSKSHTAEAAHREATARVAKMREISGNRVVDGAFFARHRDDVHKDVPWLDAATQRARDHVFEKAMAVHKAFVDAAAAPLRHNVELLLRTFFGKMAWTPKMQPFMAELWTSLFLVVPVVSTTFASIERMIGYLPPEAFGWLLVDEAGQAVPQAVVGAMMRTKRAIVVGDPLQIEPVTSLPTSLAEAICTEFGVDPAKWNAPDASVQTVADATAVLGAKFEREVGSIRVGFPLLVHRRCADPMFSLSNAVAYSHLMVHAKPENHSTIRDVLGPSHWIDVIGGRTDDKWSEAEGEAAIHILRQLAEANILEIDIYLISPFRVVAQRLRERVQSSGLLQRWTNDPWKWTRERIGTVHTVQGREADTVVFVLGAPLPAQRGARAWAGSKPNILNVAATRAKENIYVIGNQGLWREAGCFRELASRVPSGKPQSTTIASPRNVTPNAHWSRERPRSPPA
jgi:hypothetical protein